MIQTFLFRTESSDKEYHHIVYSSDIKTIIGKWIRLIEDLQNQVYSFAPTHVLHIKQQYMDGLMKIHLDKEPYFLSFDLNGKTETVHIDTIKKDQPDFTATITYLTTEQGGRKGYAASGYRPHVKFDGRKEMTSGEQLFVDKEKVFPGDTVTAEVRIVGRDFFKNYLFVGQHFEVGEGPHLVGHGEVLEVTNPDLRKSSS